MNNEISELQRNLEKLMIEHEEATIGENRGRGKKNYWEKSDLYYQKRREMRELFTSLETELAALKAEVAQYEWQSGHPEHENKVNVRVRFLNAEENVVEFTSTDCWCLECGNWHCFKRSEIIAYAEIRPYGGE